jgi:class 3 adenylate cyclase
MAPRNQPKSIRFFDLLLDYSREPDQDKRDALEKDIWAEFGARHSILVLDMSGFSKLAQRHGIVHYLAMVRRMQVTAEPIVEQYNGSVVKFEADDCFAVFPDTESAVRAAIALNQAYDAANIVTPQLLDIRVACGIDEGDVLLIDGVDFFGNAVNRACKLGEDLADPGEILVAQRAIDSSESELGYEMDPVSFSISGVEIEAYSVKYR